MTTPPMPYVVLTSTVTLDGRITVGPKHLLLEPVAAQRWHALHPPGAATLIEARRASITERLHPQAVLEGSGTFVVEGTEPEPLPPDGGDDDLHVDFLPPEVAGREQHARWFAVVDSRGRCRWTFTGSGGTDLLVLVAQSTPRAYLAYLRREWVCYLVVGVEEVDLRAALIRLAELGVTSVIADSGGSFNGALLDADLVDEVQVVVLPALVGGRETPSLVDGADPLVNPARLRLADTQITGDGVLWLSYEVLRDTGAATSGPDTVP